MFKPFRFLFAIPAWAGPCPDEPFVHYRFQHGRRFRGGPPEDFFGLPWEDQPRTRRGDIKFLLLELLSEQSGHGYDLIKQIEARYRGFRRLSPGSVYPTLQLLEDGGYVTSESSDGKRIYTITEAGRQLLAERSTQEPAGPWDVWKAFTADKPQEFHELRQAAMELAGAVIQVGKGGNSTQMQRVRELLERVKREIYAILAE